MAQPSASRWRQPPGRSRVSVFSRPSRPAISSTKRPARGESLARQAVDAAEELDVLVDGERLVEREALRHVANATLHAFGIATDVDAADQGRAGGGSQQAAQHADGGGLAGAVGAQEAEHLALLHRERQVVHRHEVAELAREPAHVDGEASVRLPPSPRLRRTGKPDATFDITASPARDAAAPRPAGHWPARACGPARSRASPPARRSRRCWWRHRR